MTELILVNASCDIIINIILVFNVKLVPKKSKYRGIYIKIVFTSLYHEVGSEKRTVFKNIFCKEGLNLAQLSCL